MTTASFFTLQLHVLARMFFFSFQNTEIYHLFPLYMIARYDADLAVWIVPTNFLSKKRKLEIQGTSSGITRERESNIHRKDVQENEIEWTGENSERFSLNSEAYRSNLISDGCHQLWQILCLWKLKAYGKDRDHTWDHYWVDISCYVPMTLTS